ncbi:MAG: hypothetical protein ACI38Y_03695 [Candidatus Methanomethylophilaceae archaeon]
MYDRRPYDMFIYHPSDSDLMRYQLMHRDIHVCDMTVRGSGVIPDPESIVDPRHLPYGTFFCGELDTDAFARWWRSRLIPPERRGQGILRERMMTDRAEPLAVRGMALGFSDSYWIRPEGDRSRWLQVEVYHNRFSDDIGDMLMGMNVRNVPDVRSPDLVTGGMMMKRWTSNGRRRLIKAAPGDDAQMVLNEVVASVIAKAIGVPHADYGYLEY